MTFDPGIDTEPAWSGDGRKLYFMSDRAGVRRSTSSTSISPTVRRA
jgi:Tol biopolymer transport system component